jgi:hypothetical protein
MTAEQVLKLLTAAASTFAEAVQLAEEVRSTLSITDQQALDERVQTLMSQNDAAFARIDARLRTLEADAP